ncbi:uncharacterized protein K460DRAFT_432825 [Cucurbitaria berberidis CBS 394.84]|uniref:Uncharacterized protein n=1 Tax=Cucurbitaria berberidis CBS 394.84 TaxID=1168544 RepID=A0A9P4L5S4_9PLEO|nr:uncharacterized protein K460DRAFT_432825 [Cucurbitaria berberidis CBS 394.84]KAF1843246.1 hypothetical protein K460DRAFT_432825 [Cucurbitaria berberidis CBS 394.84]
MTAPVTQLQVLKVILQECKNHHDGDPLQILEKDLSLTYYVKVNRHTKLHKDLTALSLIRKGCKELPNQFSSFGKLQLSVKPRLGWHLRIPLWRIVGSMYDYAFLPSNDVDVEADANMLLIGPREDITYKYFYFRRHTMMYAPHLLENDSPLLLVALAFQPSETVKNLLEHSGVMLQESLDNRAARLLEEYQGRHGGTGWAQAFDELRETMKGRWHSTLAQDYKGYNSPTSYLRSALAEPPL